jgi:hypothetical protein
VDPEAKSTLKELVTLTRENNLLLHKIRKVQKWTQIVKAVYWVIILMITLGGFYFIQPYLNSTLNYYSVIAGSGGSNKATPSSLPDIQHLQDLIKQFGGK